jgi:hypothetical protein
MAHTDTRNGTLHAPLIYRLTRKITNAYKQNFVFFYLHLNIICLFWAHGTFYWSACIKPGKCTVMYCCVVGMSLLPLFTLVFIVFWNCSDNVVFIFPSYFKYKMNGHILPQCSFRQNIQDIPWSQTHVMFNCKLSNIDTTAYQNDLDLKRELFRF